MMKKASLEKLQMRLGEYIDSCSEQPVLILRDGEPIAMLVGIRRNGKSSPKKLRDVLRKAWQDYEEHGGISHQQFWEELATEPTPRRKKGAKAS